MAMSQYSTEDEIASFEFHDSIIKSIVFSSSDMAWQIQDAVVIGKSCPDIPNRISNTLNTGDDRYAEPVLVLIFRIIKSFLYCGVAVGKS